MTAFASCGGDGDEEQNVALATTSTEAPSNPFCEVLLEGTAELDAQTAAAADTGTAQLELFIENFTEFSRLLRELAEVAPDEIDRDMETVVETWASQADMATDAAKNPVGVVAGALVRSLLSGASFEAIDEYATENCGRPLFGSTSALQAAADEIAADVVLDGPDEAALVICEWDRLRFLKVGLTSGDIRRATPDHSASSGLNVVFDGETGNIASSTTTALCGSPPRTLFSADLSHAIGVAHSDGVQVPVLVDLEAATLVPKPAVAAGPLQDFGPSRAETLTASFTPDGRGIFWRETSEGACRSFLVPTIDLNSAIARDDVEQYRIGEGGNCYDSQMYVRWVGSLPVVCADSSFLGCDDPNGTEVEDVDDGGVTESDDVSDNDLPPSERYSTGAVLYDNTLQVPETGLTYFIAVDNTTSVSVLFSWAGGDAQPIKVRDLGQGRFSILAYQPQLD